MTIKEFQEEFRFLSNFYPARIEFGDIIYPTAEHMYQAMKSLDNVERIKISRLSSPGKAKRYWKGREADIREDWKDVRVEIMKRVVRMKFEQNPHLLKKLLNTGKEILIEGNTWHDNFWGVCSCDECGRGSNILGKILMEVREKRI